MQSFAFGGERYERLEIIVYGYERAASGEFYDDNWLSIKVLIHCGGFQGKFTAAFLTSELQSFYEQITLLYESLNGEAQLQTLEEQLSLVLKGNGIGHIQMHGEAHDQHQNRLNFEIQIDQTQLYASMQGLSTVLQAYPIRT